MTSWSRYSINASRRKQKIMNNQKTARMAIALAIAMSNKTVPDFITEEANQFYPTLGKEKAVQPYRVIPHDAKTVARRKRNKIAGKERAKQRKK